MNTIEVVALVFVGLLGLLVGSFLNVVIYRLPIGKSIVSPPSACPGCGARIKPWDNLPVISWLLLRGRCRHCRTRISVRYPAVEVATAVLFVGASIRLGMDLDGSATAFVGTLLVLVAYLYFASISVALAGIDLDTHRLPNAIVLPAYPVVVVLLVAGSAFMSDFSPLLPAAMGGAAMFGAYFLMALVYPGGMGFGDVKLAGVIGTVLGFLGWGPLVVGAFSAFILGGIFGVALLLAKRVSRKGGIPFGPWMLAGAWLGIFVGESSWNWYLGLFQLA
jgi:leader peptidase (prepilin peptidase)/N-methyltransferase